MYQLATIKQFEKDYKLCKKRGYKMELLNSIFLLLEQNGSLPAKYKSHKTYWKIIKVFGSAIYNQIGY